MSRKSQILNTQTLKVLNIKYSCRKLSNFKYYARAEILNILPRDGTKKNETLVSVSVCTLELKIQILCHLESELKISSFRLPDSHCDQSNVASMCIKKTDDQMTFSNGCLQRADGSSEGPTNEVSQNLTERNIAHVYFQTCS